MRHPPEDRAPDAGMGPLFQAAQARARGHDAAQAAASRAATLDPSWRESALAAIESHARTHETFIVQDIGLVVPGGADRRAFGALATEARRRGWIESDGFATDDWGSAKTRWRSLIFEGAHK